MAQTKTQKVKRDQNGRVCPGGGSLNPKGRPKGAENQTTLDARILRKQLLAAWARTNAINKWDALVEKDFELFARLTIAMLPKEQNIRTEEVPVNRLSDEELNDRLKSILSPEMLKKMGYTVLDAPEEDGEDEAEPDA